MSALFQIASLALKVVELPVDDDVNPLVLVGDGLITGREVNNAQACMAKAHTMVMG